ncbi:purine-cytosine permease family protein [Demetria terragena]|uniref:purine-cytosine permease family protein n=1 Tax=Demetria terragena TaxID=63959 RepID=UPI00036340EF|nr:cytosine permease [Demetria terragena]
MTQQAGIEQHGIDIIPDAERGGEPRSLFAVWVAPNVNYLSIVVGATLIVLGLELWQALLVSVVGSLFSGFCGVVAVSGPPSGTSSQVVSRAMYGIRGNRIAIALNGWFVSVCYIALNWAAASTVGFSLVERMGVETSNPVKIVVILAVAGATTLISVYGQGTILRLYPVLSTVLSAVFAVVVAIIALNSDFGFSQPEPLEGTALWAALTAGLTLVASSPMSYTNSSDFARYLPRSVNPRAVAFWTAWGSFIPSVVLVSAGALGATVVDMGDPQAGLSTIVPSALLVLFLMGVIASTLSNNALTTYSAGLALQSVGVPTSRPVAVLISAACAVSMTTYALLIGNFLETVGSMMSLLVVLVGPIMTVYSIDILMRHNRYDGDALSVVGRRSAFWYSGGVNIAGAIAILVPGGLALLCASTPVYTGPIAQALGGVDLSLAVGILGSAGIYFGLTRWLYGMPLDASRPADLEEEGISV